MKIIGLEGNYQGCQTPLAPIFFADTALLRSDKPFFLPSFDSTFCGYVSLVVRIERLGKGIAPRFAHRYYTATAPGLNIRAVTLLSEMRRKGLPWSEAVSYDWALPCGDFSTHEPGRAFSVAVNGTVVATWEESKLLESIDEAIARVSTIYTLKTGDLVYVGFAPEGFPLSIDDTLTASFSDKDPSLTIRVK